MNTNRIAIASAVAVGLAVGALFMAQQSTAFASPKASAAAKAGAPSAEDQKVIDAQLADYPLETCVVTGEKLGGSMGKPINYVYKGKLVRFCCKSCIKAFNKNPDKYLKKIKQASEHKGKTKDGSASAGASGHGCCGGM